MPTLHSIFDSWGARLITRRGGEPREAARTVVYWMQHAQRGTDNWALDLAIACGNALELPVVVYFDLVPYPEANLRHYSFLLEGLRDTARQLAERNVSFVMQLHPQDDLVRFCQQAEAALLIGDENPLRESERWRRLVTHKLTIPFYTVDADVIVPTRRFDKAQYAARILRPKLAKLLPVYLQASHDPCAEYTADAELLALLNADGDASFDGPMLAYAGDVTLAAILARCEWLDCTVPPTPSFRGGTREAQRRLDEFVAHHLADYPRHHGAPERDATSHLSPYLHFGQISPASVARAVQSSTAPAEAKENFLDQLITWRELAVNFVRYCELYDAVECAEPWAHRTLAAHLGDARPVLYSRRQLEAAQTHDRLWNAAQKQMLHAGWMHNYMRMYWAKKILEWSLTPQQAYQTARYLNDKYFLDGRDPNGYAGLAWAILGKFDRPWRERPIFGTIRYMSAAAATKKFAANTYIQQMEELAQSRSYVIVS